MKNLQYALLLGIIGFSLSNTTHLQQKGFELLPAITEVASVLERSELNSIPGRQRTTLGAELREKGILQQYHEKRNKILPIIIGLEKEVNILNRLLYGVLTEGSSQPIRTIDIARFVNQEWPYTAEPLRQPYSLFKLTQKQRELSQLREDLRDQIIELSKEQHMPLLQQRFQQ